MPTHPFKASLLILLLAAACLIAVGCNTLHGLGKDVEKGGQKLQDATAPKAQDW